MTRPTLTFFNEQDSHQLNDTFSADVIEALCGLKAGIAMGLRDLSDERANVIRRLNSAGIPVTGWLLLPPHEGYFATHTNIEQVETGFARLSEWIGRHALRVERIGLDFELDLRELQALMRRPLPTFGRWLFRRPDLALIPSAQRKYQELIERIRAQGFLVETYQFPALFDDRETGSQFWQRTLGALDVKADREVVMLYTSLAGRLGLPLLRGYARRCQSIAVGSTGGGIDPLPKLSWPELERDLLIAAHHSREVFIFSLEGCLENNVLRLLHTLEWERRPQTPSLVERAVGLAASKVIRQLARWL